MDHDIKGKHILMNSLEETSKIQEPNIIEEIDENSLNWERYGTKYYPDPKPLAPKVMTEVRRKTYCEHGFMETPKFWDDLLSIGNQVCRVQPDKRNK